MTGQIPRDSAASAALAMLPFLVAAVRKVSTTGSARSGGGSGEKSSALFWGVPAERASLESIAAPLTAEEAELGDADTQQVHQANTAG